MILDEIETKTNASARAFYAKVGVIETGMRETDDQGRPLALVRMQRG